MWGWLSKSLTGADNKTPDPARLSWIYSMLAVTAAAVINAWKGVQVDLVSLATAFGLVSGAHAAGTIATSKSQPKPEEISSATISTTDTGNTKTTTVEVDTISA